MAQIFSEEREYDSIRRSNHEAGAVCQIAGAACPGTFNVSSKNWLRISAAPVLPGGFTADQFSIDGSALQFDVKLYPASEVTAQTDRHRKTSFGYHLPNVAPSRKKMSITFFEPYNVGRGDWLQDARLFGVDAFISLDTVVMKIKRRMVMKQDVYVLAKTPGMRWYFSRKAPSLTMPGVGAIKVTPLLVK